MVVQRLPPPQSKDVLYIGSAVPLETSEGLEAVQQPLRTRYPLDSDENIQGIMSTITITPDGIQLQYKNDPGHVVLFPYTGLTLCAAVRCMKTTNAATSEVTARFISVTSAENMGDQGDRPTIFTAITRRSKGRQVLECHGFITTSPKDAIDLVQWTSAADKRSKHGIVHHNTTRDSSYGVFRNDISFNNAEVRSLPEYMGGDHIVHSENAFPQEPPQTGFFYSNNNSLIKTYSLKRFVTQPQESETIASASASASAAHASDQFDRRSFVSMPASRPAPHPASFMSRTLIRGPPPHMRRAILVPGPPPPQHPPMAYARPRLLVPPPPMMVRPQGIPIIVPPGPPGLYGDFATLRPHPGRRGSRGSSRSSSRSSEDYTHVNGRHRPGLRDDSSEISSRPRSPPTDYDLFPRRHHRISRKDDFNMRRSHSMERRGLSFMSPVHGPLSVGAPPPGYFMMPGNGYLPPGAMQRSKSVPPQGGKSLKKDKSKKKKKSKKSKKNKGHNSGDISSDGAMFLPIRDMSFRSNGDLKSQQHGDIRSLGDNANAHERAFSRSVAERAFSRSLKGDTRGKDDIVDPYSINYNPRLPENVFPMY